MERTWILVNRSFSASLVSAFRRANPSLARISLGIVTVLGLRLLWPAAAAVFRFGPLHGDDLAIAVVAGGAVLLAQEGRKPIWHTRLRL